MQFMAISLVGAIPIQPTEAPSGRPRTTLEARPPRAGPSARHESHRRGVSHYATGVATVHSCRGPPGGGPTPLSTGALAVSRALAFACLTIAPSFVGFAVQPARGEPRVNRFVKPRRPPRAKGRRERLCQDRKSV